MGLSFSGGLALVAAADPLYKPDFKFVLAVGSQDSMSRVAQYYDTDKDVRPNGTVELLPAHEYGPLVLEYEYVEDFVPRQDVAAVRAVLRAHLYEDKDAEAAASLKLDARQKGGDALMDLGVLRDSQRFAGLEQTHSIDVPAPIARFQRCCGLLLSVHFGLRQHAACFQTLDCAQRVIHLMPCIAHDLLIGQRGTALLGAAQVELALDASAVEDR